jgi:hypothetical protein
LEILIATPESNGKHVNKNSLVAKYDIASAFTCLHVRYPLQRYSVHDLKEDIRMKVAKAADLSAQSCPLRHSARMEDYAQRTRQTLLRLAV